MIKQFFQKRFAFFDEASDMTHIWQLKCLSQKPSEIYTQLNMVKYNKNNFWICNTLSIIIFAKKKKWNDIWKKQYHLRMGFGILQIFIHHKSFNGFFCVSIKFLWFWKKSMNSHRKIEIIFVSSHQQTVPQDLPPLWSQPHCATVDTTKMAKIFHFDPFLFEKYCWNNELEYWSFATLNRFTL